MEPEDRETADWRAFCLTGLGVFLAVKLSDDCTGWIGDGQGVLVIGVLGGLMVGAIVLVARAIMRRRRTRA